MEIILSAGVPSSQALPGFLITAPPSVCASAVLGALAVWIQKQTEKKIQNLNYYFSWTLPWVVLPSRTVVCACTHQQMLRYHTFNHGCWQHVPSMTIG